MYTNAFIQTFIGLSRAFNRESLLYALSEMTSGTLDDGFIIPIETIYGIKSKDKNSMHRVKIGYKKGDRILLTLERVTNSKLCGDKVTKTCSLSMSPENALTLSNLLHDIVEVIYDYNRDQRVQEAKDDCDVFRAMNK